MIINDKKRLPKPALMTIATVGWATTLFLAWTVFHDSFVRTMFSFAAYQGQIPAEINPFIDRYTAHPLQTLLHTIPGMLFAMLGPMQFMSPIRDNFRIVHRVTGRIFLPIGIISGIGALAMTFSFPIWGSTVNYAIAIAFSAFMIFAFVKAFMHVRKRQVPQHREWMIRGFATGLSVATFRIMGDYIFLPMGMDFNAAWNLQMLLCFPVTLGAAEIWIRVTRPKRRVSAGRPATSASST